MSKLLSIEETAKLIRDGKRLVVSGLEESIARLPKGQWIGGTASYAMGEERGVPLKDCLCVEILDPPSEQFVIRTYGPDDLSSLTKDAFENGYSVVILPYHSEVHFRYATDIPQNSESYLHPMVGFVAGVDLAAEWLEKGSKARPMAFDGETGEFLRDRAVVMHVSLPSGYIASIGIMNGHEADPESPEIQFEESGFSAKYAIIDGVRTRFADYLIERNLINAKMINYCAGAHLNVQIQTIESPEDDVYFFAPVFKGMTYRFSRLSFPEDQLDQVIERSLEPWKDKKIAMTFNCVDNYAVFHLDQRTLKPFTGPFAFGEIAYQVLNATMVYMVIQKVG